MTSPKTSSPNSKKTYLITPSLLNSWGYIWECVGNVKEAEKDEISLEDKIALAQEKAKEDFILTLNRIKPEPNEYMVRGIEYEEDTQKGLTDASPIVEDGAWQIVGKKKEKIDGVDYLLYGRLDVLKGGVVYDIKRVSKYAPQKYLYSHQHPFYLHLFKRAYKFVYLVYDGNKLHQETYYRNEVVDIKDKIRNFVQWLKNNNLFELYQEKWQSKEE